MKRPHSRVRRRRLTVLGLVVLPPLAWTLLIAALPTGWARDRIASRLEAATGRPVALGRLRVGVLGGLHLKDLTVAAPRSRTDPWLKAADARIDVSLVQLLCGQVEPTDLRVTGLTLRVLRRADGTFELADSAPVRPAPTGPGARAAARQGVALQFHLSDARVLVVDEASGTRLEPIGVEGQGVWEGRKLTVRELRGALQGGTFELAAEVDGSGRVPVFEGQLRAERVALVPGMGLLGYLAPVLAGRPNGVEGRLDLNLYVRGHGTGRNDLRNHLVGRGSIALAPIRLDGSTLVADLADVLKLPPAERVGSCRSDFTISRGRVATENLTIELARVPLVLSGWTDFDGRLDYRFRPEQLAGRLPAPARGLLADLEADLREVNTVRVHGTLDRLAVTLGGRPLREAVADPGERQRFKGLSRKLRDRILR